MCKRGQMESENFNCIALGVHTRTSLFCSWHTSRFSCPRDNCVELRNHLNKICISLVFSL